MEDKYISNPAIKICLEHIESGSTEKEVQTLWESMLWTAFPASDHWMNQTKYKQGVTEPDNKVMKLVHFHGGWSPVDVLMVELKRLRENVSSSAFNDIANSLLEDYMSESGNAIGTTLFGAVGIGAHVQFYRKVLPGGQLETWHPRPLHIEVDEEAIQGIFDFFKESVPLTSSLSRPPGPGMSTALPAGSQTGMPSQYYHVQDRNYFYYDNGDHRTLPSRPDDVWVFHEDGWKDTGRAKKWRFCDGHKFTYERVYVRR